MALDIIGYTKDFRTDTNILYAQITIDEYLTLIGDNFQDFEIQRKREKHKAYERMKKDIKNGAVLPTITLALKPEFFSEELLEAVNNKNNQYLIDFLRKKDQIFILDGLQRSFILHDLKKEGGNLRNDQKLLIEFWIEPKFENLIYRFVVLNAGQKPMSFRHQLDILFYGLRRELEKELEGLELLPEKDGSRRSKAKQFQMKHIATSYHCFLIKNYEPAKENIIAQQMQEDKILLSDDKQLNQDFENFKYYLSHYIGLDEKIFSVYLTAANKNFLSEENVMNAFFASLAVYGNGNDGKKQRIIKALEVLKETKSEDPLGLTTYEEIKNGIPAAKKNLGMEYKRILFDGFREFFHNEGQNTLAECWEFVGK